LLIADFPLPSPQIPDQREGIWGTLKPQAPRGEPHQVSHPLIPPAGNPQGQTPRGMPNQCTEPLNPPGECQCTEPSNPPGECQCTEPSNPTGEPSIPPAGTLHQHHRRPPLINPPGGEPCTSTWRPRRIPRRRDPTSTTGDPPSSIPPAGNPTNPPGGAPHQVSPPIELPYCQASYPKTTIELPYLLEIIREWQAIPTGSRRGGERKPRPSSSLSGWQTKSGNCERKAQEPTIS